MAHATFILGQSGGGLPIAQFLKLGVFALILLFSFIGWATKKAKEKRQQREAEMNRRRAQDEGLRTGRIPPMSANMGTPSGSTPARVPSTLQPSIEDEAKRRLAELAARRRRELAEMMKNSGGGSASQTASTPSRTPPPTARPPMSRTAPPQEQPINRPQQSPRAPQQKRPASIEQQQRAQRDRVLNEKAARDNALRKKAEREELARQQRESALARAEREREQREADEVPHMRHDAAAQPVPSPAMARMNAAAANAGGSNALGADWRKAIVMAELLNRPLALRHEDE